ncbi:MAG: hypothetical protein OSJ72_01460 [Lachnospiraceae bacterium]|nr:hypothetical protein [Lachnospiraceae bacterium]
MEFVAQFTFKYLNSENFILLILKISFLLCMIMVMSYTIYNIKQIYEVFILKKAKQGFTYALLGAISTILLFNPLNEVTTEVRQFKRVFGGGFIKNYDVSKVIRNFQIWLLLFVIVFGLLFLLINYKKREWQKIEDKRYEVFLDNLIILALTVQLLRCVTYFNDKSVSNIFYYSTFLVGVWIFVTTIIISTKLRNVIDYETLIRILIITFTGGFPIAIFICKTWKSGKVLLGVQIIILCFNLLFVYVAKIKSRHYLDKICTVVSIFFAAIPLLTSAYIELIHILNQYNIFVIHIKKTYIIMIALYSIMIFFVSITVKSISFQKWKAWIYGTIVFGISCLGVQIPLQQIIEADIYESANCSILVSDFLNFGSIPIVEHYGGHMMQGVWEGIIYALLNNDYQGAILSPYSVYVYPILAILFWGLLKYIWDDDIAVWAVLLVPFYNNFAYFGLGTLVCFATITYAKKQTWLRAFGIWMAVVWCAIYRLDLGFAFAFAVISALILYILRQRKAKAIMQLGISFGATVVVGGGIWCILCWAKNINPFKRLREFIEISASNQNWAFYGIGDPSKFIFAWCYIIVPFAIVLCMLYIAFSRDLLQRIGVEIWFILIILGFSYVFNFQRGLTRHSLVENATTGILWSAILFIAIFLAIYYKNNYLCIPFLVILTVCNAAFIQNENYAEQNIIDTATAKMDGFIDTWTVQRTSCVNDNNNDKTYWEELADKNEKTTRVINTLDEEILLYQEIMKLLLEEDETYIDFMNRSFVYSAIGRKSPVYVAQSPIMLSGEYSQERFIEDIQEDIENIPVAILPIADSRLSIGYDGIANAYRYYKVAEFIYNNYRPLCSNGEFAVWCLNDRYEEMLKKLDFAVREADLHDISQLPYYDCTILQQTNGIKVMTTDVDPRIEDLHTIIDLRDMEGGYATISVEYSTKQTGLMQLFYTTDEGENFSEEKSYAAEVSDVGIADFQIYVTEHTKLRLDIPSECTITIHNISCGISRIDWGYDGNKVFVDESGNVKYRYYSQLHNYELDQLPRIWAEMDVEKAINNKVVYTIKPIGNTYVFMPTGTIECNEEGYLLLSCEYLGQDVEEKYKSNNESIRGVVCLGWYNEDGFIEKCRYSFTLQEGKHDYLIRISTDYFWHLGEINAMQFYTDYDVNISKIRILEGD